MTVQRVALVFGWVFIIIAIIGFLTSRGSMEAGMAESPRTFGLFPVNVLHNLVHLVFGIWGVAAARSFAAAKGYCQAAGVIYIVLAILGIFVPELFGIVPIGGHDVWLHAIIGIVLSYVGFTARGAAFQPAT